MHLKPEDSSATHHAGASHYAAGGAMHLTNALHLKQKKVKCHALEFIIGYFWSASFVSHPTG
ncbi:MAG: hypothetical protein WBG37_21370, partial [Desulfobacterales bacterium]